MQDARTLVELCEHSLRSRAVDHLDLFAQDRVHPCECGLVIRKEPLKAHQCFNVRFVRY